MMLKSASFWDKASSERQEDHRFQAGRCWRNIQQIIIEAQAMGDLPRDRFKPEEVTFALVSVTVGSHIMAKGRMRYARHGWDHRLAHRRSPQWRSDVRRPRRWKPLSFEADYATCIAASCARSSLAPPAQVRLTFAPHTNLAPFLLLN